MQCGIFNGRKSGTLVGGKHQLFGAMDPLSKLRVQLLFGKLRQRINPSRKNTTWKVHKYVEKILLNWKNNYDIIFHPKEFHPNFLSQPTAGDSMTSFHGDSRVFDWLPRSYEVGRGFVNIS